MKTYYLYGKLLRDGFHVKISLYDQAPFNYYFLGTSKGKNYREAWLNILRDKNWSPPRDYVVTRKML